MHCGWEGNPKSDVALAMRYILGGIATVGLNDHTEREMIIRPRGMTSLIFTSSVARWCNGKAFGLAISGSRVQILLEATLRNNLRQVVYTYVPPSPSSITWYRRKGGDALRLGR